MLTISPTVAKTSKNQTNIVITINHLQPLPIDDIVRLIDQRAMYDIVNELGADAEDWSTNLGVIDD
jgi:hypothetical protein